MPVITRENGSISTPLDGSENTFMNWPDIGTFGSPPRFLSLMTKSGRAIAVPTVRTGSLLTASTRLIRDKLSTWTTAHRMQLDGVRTDRGSVSDHHPCLSPGKMRFFREDNAMRFAFMLLFVASLIVCTAEETHATVNRHHPGAHRSVGSRVHHTQTYHRSAVRWNWFR